jgi:hypothetical protein
MVIRIEDPDPQGSALEAGLEKTRVFLKKPSPVGFFGFFWFFFVFFWVFLPRREGFQGFISNPGGRY